MKLTNLNRTLKRELGEYFHTVLIDGPWGVGKTYTIKQYVSNKKTVIIYQCLASKK